MILADPPWEYKNKNTGGSMKSGAKNKYDTINAFRLREIGELLEPMLDDPCYCFLWTTNTHIEEALAAMFYWGFEYKTTLTWIKDYGGEKMGMGFWFRGGTEHLLVGSRGKKVKPFNFQYPNHFKVEVALHSEKPIWTYLMIEQIPKECLGGQKLKPLELFARKQRKYWDAAGYEFDGKDIRESLKDMHEILKIDNICYV
jgi:site-specific DNA-methyltransferase (adenine-specific)